MTGFIYYFAALGAILSGSAIFPSLVAFGLGETDIGNRMMLWAMLGGFLSVSVLLSIVGRDIGLERRAAALLVVASWLIFPLMIAIVLADIADIEFHRALFQSIASFTTTGSNVFVNPQATPGSIVFLLAQFQWMGGLATLITFILILSPWQIGGLPKMGSVSETASIVASEYRLARFCGRLLRGVGGLTLLCFAFLVLAGIAPFDAAILSFTALSTGGIVPATDNLDLLLGNSGMITMAVFLILGGTSIFWHRQIANFRLEDLRAHRESYYVLGIWLLTAFILFARLNQVSGSLPESKFFTAISEAMFNAASLVTTSGIQSRPGIFILLAPTAVVFIILIGSGTFSTAGGMKMFRMGVILAHARKELQTLVFPSSVDSERFSGGRLDLPFMKRVWGFFAIWLIVLGAGGYLLSASGMHFQAAFTAATAALTNAGPVYGTFWNVANNPGWIAYADMSGFQLSLLSVLMLLGRLEIIVIIASVALGLKQFR